MGRGLDRHARDACKASNSHLLIWSAKANTRKQQILIYISEGYTQIQAILDERYGFGGSVEQCPPNITCHCMMQVYKCILQQVHDADYAMRAAQQGS